MVRSDELSADANLLPRLCMLFAQIFATCKVKISVDQAVLELLIKTCKIFFVQELKNHFQNFNVIFEFLSQ